MAEKPLLKVKYEEEIILQLVKRFSYKNNAESPRLTKIVLNVGTGVPKTSGETKYHDSVRDELAAITGQKPAETKARASISNFKVRKGMPLGWKTTLRGNRMYEFLDRFIHTAVPQIRDFRGLPRSGFDGRGNFSLGLREQTIFSEIKMDKIAKHHGMDLIFVTTAKSDEEGEALMEGFGFPFRRKQKAGS